MSSGSESVRFEALYWPLPPPAPRRPDMAPEDRGAREHSGEEANEREAVSSSKEESASQDGETSLEDSLRSSLEPEFEVVRRLAASETATVYLLREPALRRLVAVKVLSPRLARNAKALLRFDREVRAVARISHPNVVTVFRVGALSDGTPFLIMQYVKGRSLEARLKAEGRLAVNEVRRVLSQVAAALAAAHENGVVHRDVKAANVLYDEVSLRCLLTDFGIAAVLATGEESERRITTAGHVVADFKYVSPEQLKGEPLTGSADVYGLAILAYELLANRFPYEASTPREFADAHLNREPARISSLRPDVTADLEDLLGRCLAKDPLHRPRAADLARRLGGSREAREAPPEAPHSPPPGPPDRDPPAPSHGAHTAASLDSDGSSARGSAQPGKRTRLRTLGGLELDAADGRRIMSVLAQPKRIALLTYLAVGGVRGFKRRDTLMGLLWADLDAERARHALRQSVYVLRRALGPKVLVSRGDEELGLDAQHLWCDATEFERAAAGDRDEEALDLYEGDLLPGFFLSGAPEFERWLELERLRLARLASGSAWRLADRCEAEGKGREAAEWARRATERTLLDESALRRLIELLERQGDRAGAIQAYEGFTRRLATEYEAEPSVETRELITRVRDR